MSLKENSLGKSQFLGNQIYYIREKKEKAKENTTRIYQ